MGTAVAKATRLYLSGDLKGALRIFKKFDRIFGKENCRVLQIAYETLTGHGGFYKQLGINTSQCVAQSKEILETNCEKIKEQVKMTSDTGKI